METVHALLLQALSAALHNMTVSWNEPLQSEMWKALFSVAYSHRVLPLVYESVYRSEAAMQADPEFMAQFKRRAMQDAILQARRTQEFLALYDKLCAAQFTPLVIKGIVCRSLYPNPDLRLSSDEDIVLPKEQLRACHRALLAAGLQSEAGEEEMENAYETAFFSHDRVTQIEVHSHFFPLSSGAYGNLAGLFDNAFSGSIEREIAGHSIRTLNHTDHMLFLLCHAFKHFLHSGFGVRQVCDIALYANSFGSEIDWAAVQAACRSVRAEHFTAAVFSIAEQYFTFDPTRACFPALWRMPDVDPEPLLADLLDSGVYGGANLSRRHSSHITLNAVTAAQSGTKNRTGVLKALFPPSDSLKKRYNYLQKRKWLLPIAWVQRLAHYCRETTRKYDSSAADAVRIGHERSKLLRKYDII